ncbi:hypothetical protein OIDMADRAFT_20507 [Oidiodendron maius Zn]|uniref:Uncharacterized protein n=1 Tax=Oidiodendron maius (strain Zn) TaxID=913774 RepID=A0A0C3CEF1_OIDMZ|nr:hypothetical protein OIDMADRAFT_20507 [Oidiodendron maius Zn]
MGNGGDVLGTSGQDTVGGNNDGMGGLEPSLYLLSQIDISHMRILTKRLVDPFSLHTAVASMRRTSLRVRLCSSGQVF